MIGIGQVQISVSDYRMNKWVSLLESPFLFLLGPKIKKQEMMYY